MEKFGRLFLILISLTCVLSFSIGTAKAGSKSLNDQQQTNDRGWYLNVENGQEVAQTFVSGKYGYLTQVSVLLEEKLGYNNNISPNEILYPGDLLVEIRPMVLGKACLDGCNSGTAITAIPSDEILASTVLPEVAVDDGIAAWYTVSFSNPPLLKKGESYAIVLKTNDVQPPAIYPSVQGSYLWLFDADEINDPYPSGTMMSAIVGQELPWSFSEYWKEDATFITYMSNPNGRKNKTN